ncbi:MAG: four helix bundle protein [Tissierellia bacterium]|nr:four helix bundle protein [Paludibacteraceae bacterium]NLA12983.1 four helix bundle protein [Tissierellia bacterium]HOS88921.1 four helix bundle protein [bacterium]HQK41919.1 four helix bundle protein [bacterium]
MHTSESQSKFTLYIKLFQFQKYIYLMVHNFPKEYKYGFGQSIIDMAWETLDNTIKANITENNFKADAIAEISKSFDKLKTRLRMAYELRLISNKSYTYILKETTGMGREISRWMNWAKSIKPKQSSA